MKYTREKKGIVREGLEASMFKFLQEKMDPQLKAKLPVSVLREVLSYLGEWAYVERNKWLVPSKETGRGTGQPVEPVSAALKERLKPDVVETTFLDALDQIR